MAPYIWDISETINTITPPAGYAWIVDSANLCYDGVQYYYACFWQYSGGNYYCIIGRSPSGSLSGQWTKWSGGSVFSTGSGCTFTTACTVISAGFSGGIYPFCAVALSGVAGNGAGWFISYSSILSFVTNASAGTHMYGAQVVFPEAASYNQILYIFAGCQNLGNVLACYYNGSANPPNPQTIIDTSAFICSRGTLTGQGAGVWGGVYAYYRSDGGIYKVTITGAGFSAPALESNGYGIAMTVGNNNNFIRESGVDIIQLPTQMYYRSTPPVGTFPTAFNGMQAMTNGMSYFAAIPSSSGSWVYAGSFFDGYEYVIINNILATLRADGTAIIAGANGWYLDTSGNIWSTTPIPDPNYLEGGSITYQVAAAPQGTYKRKVVALQNELIILYKDTTHRLGGFWWRNCSQNGIEYSGDLISPFQIDCQKTVTQAFVTQNIPSMFMSLLTAVSSYCTSTGVVSSTQSITVNQRKLDDSLSLIAALDGHVWWQDFNDLIHEDAEAISTGLSVVFGTQAMGDPTKKFITLQIACCRIWYGIGTAKSCYTAIGQMGSGYYETWIPNYTLAQATALANAIVTQNQEPVQWTVPTVNGLDPIQVGNNIQFGIVNAYYNQATTTFYVQRNDINLDSFEQSLILNDGFYYNLTYLNPQSTNSTDQKTMANQISNLNDGLNQSAIVAQGAIQITNIGNNVSDPTNAQDVATKNYVNPYYCHVKRNTTQQVIATGTTTAIIFNAEVSDGSAMHDPTNTTTQTKITVPVAGLYYVVAHVAFANDSRSFRTIGLYVNGSIVCNNNATPTPVDVTQLQISAVLDLAAGAYLQIEVYQNTSANLNIMTETDAAYMITDFKVVGLGGVKRA